MKEIYYLDENLTDVDSLVDILEEEGYKVRSFRRDSVLIETLEHGASPDLLILDIMMPSGIWGKEETSNGRITGLLVLKKIREIRKKLCIIVYSVVKKRSVIEEAKKYNIAEYIIKPALPSDLIEKVKKALGDTNGDEDE